MSPPKVVAKPGLMRCSRNQPIVMEMSTDRPETMLKINFDHKGIAMRFIP